MILVTVRDNEPFEKALRRFRRKVEREGIRKDIKKNSFYLKPGEKRRLKQLLEQLEEVIAELKVEVYSDVDKYRDEDGYYVGEDDDDGYPD